jgi:hypothetical protein
VASLAIYELGLENCSSRTREINAQSRYPRCYLHQIAPIITA